MQSWPTSKSTWQEVVSQYSKSTWQEVPRVLLLCQELTYPRAETSRPLQEQEVLPYTVIQLLITMIVVVSSFSVKDQGLKQLLAVASHNNKGEKSGV